MNDLTISPVTTGILLQPTATSTSLELKMENIEKKISDFELAMNTSRNRIENLFKASNLHTTQIEVFKEDFFNCSQLVEGLEESIMELTGDISACKDILQIRTVQVTSLFPPFKQHHEDPTFGTGIPLTPP